jgi:hypothetical protein
MHDLHDHISKQLAQHLAKRAIVVWYDPRCEFAGYIGELFAGSLPESCRLDAVTVDGVQATFCMSHGSLYEAKFLVEPMFAVDQPNAIVIYVSGQMQNPEISPLAELEKAGTTWEPQLKREARRVLKTRYGDGQIDQIFQSDKVSYADIVSLLAEDSGGSHSQRALLSVIFAEARGDNAAILADWLADASHDAEIIEKSANVELLQLIASRLGLELPDEATLDDARRRTARYVLVGEFRSDLACEVPAVLQMIPSPEMKDQWTMIGDVAQKFRHRHGHAYAAMADSIQTEFSLTSQGIPPAKLGEVDTFRFEEQMLLDYTAELIAEGQFKAAVKIVEQHRLNFWSEHDFRRQEQWRVHELMAQLGEVVEGRFRRCQHRHVRQYQSADRCHGADGTPFCSHARRDSRRYGLY